jgi:hypothetical protein
MAKHMIYAFWAENISSMKYILSLRIEKMTKPTTSYKGILSDKYKFIDKKNPIPKCQTVCVARALSIWYLRCKLLHFISQLFVNIRVMRLYQQIVSSYMHQAVISPYQTDSD